MTTLAVDHLSIGLAAGVFIVCFGLALWAAKHPRKRSEGKNRWVYSGVEDGWFVWVEQNPLWLDVDPPTWDWPQRVGSSRPTMMINCRFDGSPAPR